MRAAGVALVAFGVAQWALVNALWLYNDRYYIVLLPSVVFVAAQAGPIRPAIAGVFLALWFGVAVSGTRDILAFNDACAKAVARLESAGVPAADIDAGYVLNGWRLYNHPERLGPGRDRRYDVPFVTGGGPTPYALTNQPEPNADIVETIQLPAASWQSTRQFYVVHRRGVPSTLRR
jgi:hypothetical protein